MSPFNIEDQFYHTSPLNLILIILIGFIFFFLSIIYTNQLKVNDNISFSKYVCSKCYFEYNLRSLFSLFINSIKGFSCINCKNRFGLFSLILSIFFITFILLNFLFFDLTDAVFFSVLQIFLYSIMVIDFDMMIINIQSIVIILLIGVIYKLTKFDFDLYILQDMILGFIIGWSLIFTISNLYCLIRKEQGFGSGDKWLLGALGLWFGYYNIVIIFFGSCIFSTFFIFIMNLQKDTIMKKVPIGSFFCLTSLLHLFFI